MTPDLDTLVAEMTYGDPLTRERAARGAIYQCRQVRADALRELHQQLGSWQKVGDATGLPRQDAWRMAKGGR